MCSVCCVVKLKFTSSSSGGISSKGLASLCWSFYSLKTFSHVFVLLAVFEFSFLLLRVLISSSCNHGNLSFVLELLKMEKFGKFSSLNSSMLSTTMATCPAFSADVCSLLIGWFHNPLFFSRISLAETNCPIFSQIGQFLHFYSNSILKTVQIKSQIGQF